MVKKVRPVTRAKKFVLEDLPIAKVTANTERHYSNAIFKNKKVIKNVLMQCFLENDIDAFADILEVLF